MLDFGAGIDALSAESRIPEGYSERLTNVDPTPEGYLRKRAGYSSTSGWVPLRIISVTGTASSDELCFYLDTGLDATSIDLSEVRSSPIVVHGRLDQTYGSNWDLTATDSTHYYEGFTPDVRYTFTNGSSSHTIEGNVHNLGDILYARVATSLSAVTNSNSPFLPNEVEVTISNDNVTASYTNGGPTFDGFIYLLSGATEAGTSYNQTGVWPGTSLTVLESTHQLSNFNLLPILYEGNGTSWREVIADVSINSSGDVTFSTSTGFTGGYTDYLLILRAVAPTQTYSINIPANSTVSTPINVSGDFLVNSLYEDDGSTKVLVLPDNIVVDGNVATITVSNYSSSPKLLQWNWEYARLITNKICVTNSANATGDFTSSSCQVTIWGLNHAEIYSSDTNRAGWVTHIDTYRSEAEEYLVCGLGGTLFTPSADSSYLLGEAYPRLRNRIGASTVIGPAFGTNTSRSRGSVSYVGDGEGYAQATSISYQSGSGYVRYTLSTPSLSTTGTPISTTLNQEDWLTVEQAANSIHNGSFRIRAVSYGANTMTIDVLNEAVDSSDYDESDCGARCGVFSDQLPLSSTNDFVPGDRLVSTAINEADQYVVLSSSASLVVVSGAVSYRTFVNSIRIAAVRTSSIIPLRELDDTPTSANFVRGDVVSLTNYERTPQILYVNTLADTSVTTSAVSGVATVTLGSGDTSGLSIGQRVVLLRSAQFTGEHLVVDVPSNTTFQFLTTEDDASNISGTLLGNTIQLYEELEWEDSVNSSFTVTVPSRWVPIESPTDSYNLTQSTYPKYFDSSEYTNQPIIRSSISNDNMYFTNYGDEVLKYDGTSLFRAGLPRWQPQLFLTKDTAASAKIDLFTTATDSVHAFTNNVFKVDLGDESKFLAGQYISVSESGTILGEVQVVSTYTDATHGYIRIFGAVATIGTIGNVVLTLIQVMRYYFRLNLVDANSNLVASAVTGADDYLVRMAEDAANRIRLVGMPAWDNYDYDRIEVEIYRTKANTVAPFYKITTLEVPFNNYDGYLDYTDTTSDDTLTSLDLVSTATVGAELGTGWSEPLRAKYITSADNRLVLANLRDYPKLTAVFRDVGLTSASDYDGRKLLLRKDNADTLTTSNCIDRQYYEWRTTGDVSVSSIALVSGNTYRVTTAATTFSVGDWIYLFRNSAATTVDLSFAGWFQVTSVAGGGFTCDIVSKSGLSWAAPSGVNRLLVATSKVDVPVWLGTDYCYATANGNQLDSVSLTYTALRRLGNAINASMRVCQSSGFTPWVIASSGSEFGGDTLILSQPKVLDSTMELVLPAAISGVDYYVNDLKRSASQEVSARVQLFNSRLVVSYQNFPELFDRPTDYSSNSTLVYDINPADGQEITGIIPFFGDSAFGGASTDSVVVVFKTNSIYLVDLGGNSINETRIQKIDSRGIGCTAPYSIAPTQNGVMFATGSGIYRLRRDLSVQYIGRRMERIWQEEVNEDYLDIVTGHYYPIGNQYKISVPLIGETSNSTAYVYNTVREYMPDGYRDGSWTEYTAQPACGWANTSLAAFMASTRGDVYQILAISSEKPFRDNGDAIAAVATLRSLDFGDGSIRKAVGAVLVDYRVLDDSRVEDVVLSSAIDNKDQFEDADAANIDRYDSPNDGLGSTGETKVRTIRYTIGRRKGLFIQLRLTNEELDSPMEIAGLNLKVAGLATKGTLQAKQTQ
jgi:hypothetical protein